MHILGLFLFFNGLVFMNQIFKREFLIGSKLGKCRAIFTELDLREVPWFDCFFHFFAHLVFLTTQMLVILPKKKTFRWTYLRRSGESSLLLRPPTTLKISVYFSERSVSYLPKPWEAGERHSGLNRFLSCMRMAGEKVFKCPVICSVKRVEKNNFYIVILILATRGWRAPLSHVLNGTKSIHVFLQVRFNVIIMWYLLTHNRRLYINSGRSHGDYHTSGS